MSDKITIAVDAMGGDFAPAEIVRGALQAIREEDVSLILVGDEARIRNELAAHELPSRLEIVHTSEYISMEESPSAAVRKKKNASMAVAARLVKEGKAQALVSAGNTGALMEVALLTFGRIHGIKRPAIATVWPVKNGRAMLLDAGANAECKPEHLLQFARMGTIYCEKVLEVSNPRVGLINIGEEPGKGNPLTVHAFQLLKGSNLNFYGNVEVREFINGFVDIAVCDGFTGNIVLKTAEGVAALMTQILKDSIPKTLIRKIGAFLLKPVFRELRNKLDSSEYGGAPFLGLKGICIKSHGRANAKAVKNAIKVAEKSVKSRFIEKTGEHTEQTVVAAGSKTEPG
jgi:glycerol-3-phosphate acyltransferase PlsX